MNEDYRTRTAELEKELGAAPGKIEFLQDEAVKRELAEDKLREYSHELRERVKELNCLYAISRLVDKQEMSLREIFKGTVELISSAWQYPELAVARIVFENEEITSDGYVRTEWSQNTDIAAHGAPVGLLEICYTQERPIATKALFSRKREI